MSLKEKVNFNLIRYANCWEDADILLEGLQPQSGDKILSIGSAGDNSFSLLTKNPKIVVAVDVNAIQIHLIELKKAAFKKLEHDDFLEFLGFNPSENRIKQFESLKNLLPQASLNYWNLNTDLLERGIIHQGKFEKYFKLFRKKILPLIHKKKTILELFETKTLDDQSQFIKNKWNTIRWKLLFRIFFSKVILGKFGRDPQFLNEVNLNVSEYLLKKANNHLSSKLAYENYFLRYIMTGHFGFQLPHYARAENFNAIKKNIDNLITFEGFAQGASLEYGKFDAMNLSNIFEYMSKDLFFTTAKEIVTMCQPRARIAYWNLMVDRQISEIFPQNVTLSTRSTPLSERDKGFFYKSFTLNEVL